MPEEIINNKRIAKNTIVLYFRMIIVMAIGFYTSRLVLEALGVDDYGLYNVVGGVVGFFSFLSVSMMQCTQRFLNVEMAKENGCLNEVFNASVSIHIIIAGILFLLAESVGLWFLNTYIQIPLGREYAANFVFQTTIISLFITVITIPYNALIIAHEKMSVFALVGVIDALIKLLIAIIVLHSLKDSLILYGALMVLVSVFDFFFYYGYCRKHYSDSKYFFKFNGKYMRSMFGFTSWRMLGTASSVLVNQGNSMLVNIFYSVTANAAMSIGSQVNQAVVGLTSNFQTAFTPQITKSYASKDYSNLLTLIFATSKISFLLLFVVSVPIVYNINWLLNIWLTIVPVYASVFAILSLSEGIINAMSSPLDIAIMATGNIKRYQVFVTIISLIDIPLLFVLFTCGLPPYYAMVVKILISMLLLFVRVFFVSRSISEFSIKRYMGKVLSPSLIVLFLCYLLLFILSDSRSYSINPIIANIVLITTILSFSYFICLNGHERKLLVDVVGKILKRH